MSYLSNTGMVDDDCNLVWNEEVFYDLGLDQVWCINGDWIPDEERYHINENGAMDWYSYSDLYHIAGTFPALLPTFAIEDMDQYYRDRYYGIITEDN